MDECNKCGITGDKARLFDAISDEGIVKICERCSREEDIPIIRRPTSFQLKEAERKHSVYERLSGVKREVKTSEEDKWKLKKEEITLREIVDRNYKNKVQQEKQPRPDLIDNFHWAIMRERRARKISQEQMAKEVGESVAAIKMAEQGILPEDDYKLINKMEKYLGINLIRKEFEGDIKNKTSSPARILNFDRTVVENLTISDLQEMKKKRENAEIQEEEEETDLEEDEEIKDLEDDSVKDNKKNSDKLSKDDIDEFIWKR